MENVQVENYNNTNIQCKSASDYKFMKTVSFGGDDSSNYFNNTESIKKNLENNNDKYLSREGNEEFWDDVKDKNNTCDIPDNRNLLLVKSDFASNNKSKLIRYDNSLFKSVNFDDLLTGGKVLKTKIEFEYDNPKSDGNYHSNKESDFNNNITQYDLNKIDNRVKFILNAKNKNKNLKSRNFSQENKYTNPKKVNFNSSSQGKSSQTISQKKTKSSIPLSDRQKNQDKISNYTHKIWNKNKTRLNSLYKNGKERAERLQKKQEKIQELKNAKELEDCTFIPLINTNYVTLKKNILNNLQELSVYERQLIWTNKKLEKLEKEKNNKKLQEDIECTFAPQISNDTVNFNRHKKIDRQTKKYFERINRGKKCRDEINSKLNPDFNIKYDKIEKDKTQKKEIINVCTENKNVSVDQLKNKFGTIYPNLENEQIDYETARKNLHSKLLSLNFIDGN